MRRLDQIAFSLKALFFRKKLEQQLSDEVRIHLEMATEANLAAGMSPNEARYAALREFGNVGLSKEETRDERGWIWLDRLGKDVAFAARSLRRTPGFTAVVILTLALGIGANTAVFTLVNALMLRSLPIREPSQLVLLTAVGAIRPNQEFPYPLFEKEGPNPAFPFPFYELFRNESKTLSDVVAAGGWVIPRPLLAVGFGGTKVESAPVEEVTGNYFSALGVSAVLGRTFSMADDQPGHAEPVVVISNDFWRRRFNADPSVLGKVLRLDNVPVTIVGVIASGFSGAQVGVKPDLWFPIQLSPTLDGNLPWGAGAMKSETLPWIHILGRMLPGISRAKAAAELDIIFQRKLAQLDPRRVRSSNDASRVNLLAQRIEAESAATGYGGVRSLYQRPVSVLMIIVGVMQLIACANVAGLLLARGAARQREFSLRSALGASRSRLVGQLLTESLVLAAVAGLLGVMLAEGSTRLLGHYLGDLELWADGEVLLFAFLATLITGIGFGLVPALRLSRRDLTSTLKDSDGVGRQRLNFGLVITQIGFSFLLLAVAGLFARTLQNLSSIDTGFQRHHRQLFDLNLADDLTLEQRSSIYHRLASAIEALPGVDSVTAYQGISLLGEMAFEEQFSVSGYVPARDEVLTSSDAIVGSRFFETMGIGLLQGRDFGFRDEDARSHGVPAIVISEWSAKKLFGDADPIGKRIKLDVVFEVVGVAKNVKYGQLREGPRFQFYLPLGQRPNTMRVTFAVKTTGPSATVVSSLPAVLRQIDSRAEISGLRTIEEKLDEALVRERLIAHLAGFFGLSALVLSGVGLFGLLSYSVSRRTREIGIRVALGASVKSILMLIARQGFALGLVGCLLGLVASFVFTRFVGSMLYGVQSIDPLTFLAAALLLLVVALVACVLPAHRAARVDPVVALRAE